MKTCRSIKSQGVINRIIACSKGFTLIEMALVLALVGILLSMGVELLPMMVKHAKFSENKTTVKEAKAAIIGYALAKGRLPWADNDGDGEENTDASRGSLPYITLGIPGNDAYKRTLLYAVDAELPRTADAAALETRLGQLINNPSSRIHTPAQYCDGTNIQAAFVVFSAGKNGAANPPNNAGNQYAMPYAPETDTYDDILDAETLTHLYSLLCLP